MRVTVRALYRRKGGIKDAEHVFSDGTGRPRLPLADDHHRKHVEAVRHQHGLHEEPITVVQSSPAPPTTAVQPSRTTAAAVFRRL